jgi:1-acyl-sn-glycerol-3-phosphate acyltransferase
VKRPLVRSIVAVVLGAYLRLYHRLELRGGEYLPRAGPALVLVNHASLLDVPALMVVDPYPNTATVAKGALFKVPVVSWLLRQWGAIPVERQGRDSTGVRLMMAHLRSGGVLAVAAEGTRTRNGRLQSINPVLARIAARAGVPLVPVGVSGSYEALPPGARFPRPKQIVIRVGPAFQLAKGTDTATATRRIQEEIARLLPAHMQPEREELDAAGD